SGLLLIFYLHNPSDPGTVNEIRIIGKSGIDLRKLEEVLDTPDYYLELLTDQGAIRTKTFKDTRVGNGLTFKLPVPVPLAAVKEVKIWDENVGSDKQVDRLDLPTRETDGEKFHFSLTGQIPPRPPTFKIGLALYIAGGAILLITLLTFLRSQVL